MAGGVEAGDAVDDGGERGPLVLLDETPIADVLEPPVGDVGGDLLHGVEAEVAAVGEDRGEQRAHLPGVDPLLAGLLEVDAEPEVVLDLDEQVGEPDRAAAGVQPAVELGEAVRLRRVGLLHRRVPYCALQLHDHQRAQAEPLACITARMVSVPCDGHEQHAGQVQRQADAAVAKAVVARGVERLASW